MDEKGSTKDYTETIADKFYSQKQRKHEGNIKIHISILALHRFASLINDTNRNTISIPTKASGLNWRPKRKTLLANLPNPYMKYLQDQMISPFFYQKDFTNSKMILFCYSISLRFYNLDNEPKLNHTVGF